MPLNSIFYIYILDLYQRYSTVCKKDWGDSSEDGWSVTQDYNWPKKYSFQFSVLYRILGKKGNTNPFWILIWNEGLKVSHSDIKGTVHLKIKKSFRMCLLDLMIFFVPFDTECSRMSKLLYQWNVMMTFYFTFNHTGKSKALKGE